MEYSCKKREFSTRKIPKFIHTEKTVIDYSYFFQILKIHTNIILQNYHRKPRNPEIGRYLEKSFMLIFFKQHFLTCINKFSKFPVVLLIASRNVIDIKTALLNIHGYFKTTKLLVPDNEKSFQSTYVKSLLKDHFYIEQFVTTNGTTPLYSNGNNSL